MDLQALMGDTGMGFDLHEIRTRASEAFRPATDVFAQVRNKLQNCVKVSSCYFFLQND